MPRISPLRTHLLPRGLLRSGLSLALGAVLLAAVPAIAGAQQPVTPSTQAGSPSQLVLANSERVLRTLESRRAEFSRDRAELQRFITGEFDTMFDRDYAARQVLGRHGRGASDADVKLFGDALAENLMRRYGSSLLDFNTQLRVRIKSETPLPRGLGVRVSSELLRSGGEPIPVDYLMRQSGGSWKVFDVMVEGVSFVRTFRDQFDGELQSKSIRQVAQQLRSGQIQATAEQ
ncbi:ABC transporter substrate-binding protein [Luteimonas sp. BDR2-5]|uniref:MlaC/ttg2D family ABC transporter substrate-binding protein n=1 Tax=Proluteimonas luteida TaxID=2878685 RepID=UPI001E5E2593|nr:ABC transporter substrate-binding protein [Luteimonas sp. BDR2-5]MCD9029043.1 ABC transporter substrate-binding protein [Luteimonas sp. BDR2-5]